MKNYIDQIEEKLSKNLTLKDNIWRLIERGITSKQNIIPHFENTKIHKQLIEEEIVKDYQGTHYMIEDSNLLAYVCYQFFKKKLNAEEVNDFEGVEAFLELMKQEESSQNRMGFRTVTKHIFTFLLIWLNQMKGYQFDHILRITNKKEYNNTFSFKIKPVQNAIKYSNLSPERIVQFVTHCIEVGGYDSDWYSMIKERCKNDISEAWQILKIAKTHEEKCRFLIAHVLHAISEVDFLKAFNELKKLLNSATHAEASLLGLSLLVYPNQNTIKEILNLVETSNETSQLTKAKIYSKILKSERSTDVHKRECIEFLEKLANSEDSKIKGQILYHILSIKNNEEKVIDILKKYYITGNPEEKHYWHDINYGLADFKDKEPLLLLLEHFILLFPKIDFTKEFDFILRQIPKEKISYYITKWFNSDEFILNLKAAEIVRSSSMRHKDLILSKELLDRYSVEDVEFTIYKILGFVISHERLSELTFSVLQRTPESKIVNEIVEYFFIHHILFNYKSPIAYLKEKKKAGTKTEKKVATKILKSFNKKNKAIRSLPKLKELQGSSVRLQEYMKRQSKKWNLEESIHKGSAFMAYARNIDLRAGKGFFNRYEDGTYSEISLLNNFRMEMEFPAGEFIDPTGQALFRAFCQSYKRRSI